MSSDAAAIKGRYRQFADVWCKGYSDVYYRLALEVSEDDEVAAFLAALPVSQPNLFFASIQLLTGPEDMPRTAGELRSLLEACGDQVRGVMAARRTQTNEVGRCAALLPALPTGPLALVEVGASAGLCLLLDRFHYRWHRAAMGGSSALGPAASPVRLVCAVAGRVPIPDALPAVVWRHGLDLHPLDVRDDDAARWLVACVWPDHVDRRRRLEAAIELARARPPAVRAGDLVDDLPAVLDEAPVDAQLVVFHSAVLSYVDPDRRRAFAAALGRASTQREVVWVSNEAPGIVDEIAALAPPQAAPGRFLLGRTRFTCGGRTDEFLAFAHPHGAELAWHDPG